MLKLKEDIQGRTTRSGKAAKIAKIAKIAKALGLSSGLRVSYSQHEADDFLEGFRK
jgi:hypothetical protein